MTAIAAAIVGVLSACTTTAFVCDQSDQCGASGTCQPDGYCSFPDDTCESGQRYGDHAGSLSDECVVVEATAETGAETANPPDSTTSPTTSGSGETTTAVDSDTGTDETSTTGPPLPACSQMFVDSFDGNAVSEDWFLTGDENLVVVEDGAVTMTVPASPGIEYVQLVLEVGAGLDLRDGWVRVELSAVPNELRKQGTLTLTTEGGQYLWLAEGGIRPTAPEMMLPGLGEWDPVAHRWLQIRGAAGELVYEFSEDAATWNELTRVPAPAGLANAGLRLTAGHYEDTMTPADFVVETFEVCYD